jgi:hypothetical protein
MGSIPKLRARSLADRRVRANDVAIAAAIVLGLSKPMVYPAR